jgi:hypothetical protein
MKNIQKFFIFSFVILFLTITGTFAYEIDFNNINHDVSTDKADTDDKISAIERKIKSVPGPVSLMLLGVGLICFGKMIRKSDK